MPKKELSDVMHDLKHCTMIQETRSRISETVIPVSSFEPGVAKALKKLTMLLSTLLITSWRT